MCTGPPPATPAEFTTTSRRPCASSTVRDRRRDRRLVGDVGNGGSSRPAPPPPPRPSARASLRSRPATRAPFVGEPERGGLAEARRRAGDQRDLAVQPSHRWSLRTSMPSRGTAASCAPLNTVCPWSPPVREAYLTMKFALFYEIPVAAPVDARQGAPGVQEHARAGDPRRPDGLPRVLDRRAPLPRGVLALLEPRGALRRGRGAHREHPHRVRRAPAAEAVQPPDPHRGVGRGARPHLRRPRRLRHRPLVDARRARGLRRRPRRDARDVARGARAHRRRVDRGRVPGRRRVLEDGRAAPRAPEAAAAAAPADLRRDQQPARPRGDGAAAASACARSPSGSRPSSSRSNIAMYREGLAECEQPAGKFVNDTAATFTMVHCAPTSEEATEVAKESFEWYPKLRRRAHRVGRGVAGGARHHRTPRHLPVHRRHAEARSATA